MESYIRYLAGRWFQKQARRLAQQLPGIRQAEDMECVHRARVACRRLRAGLDLFADWPSAKKHRRWQTQIRRFGRKLGKARDHDVQLVFLAERAAQASSLPVRVGLAALILCHQADRWTAYRKAWKAARRLEASGLLKEIRRQTAEELRHDQVSEQELASYPLWEEAAEQIQSYTDELITYAPSLHQPQEQACHHAMRIAAKKLRYSLEILTPLLGSEAEPILQALETFQTLMGQVHDCQVWLTEFARLGEEEVLERLRKKWNKAGFGDSWTVGAFRQALQWLETDRRHTESQLLKEAAGFWTEKLQEEITDRLASLTQKAALRSAKLPLVLPRFLRGAKGVG